MLYETARQLLQEQEQLLKVSERHNVEVINPYLPREVLDPHMLHVRLDFTSLYFVLQFLGAAELSAMGKVSRRLRKLVLRHLDTHVQVLKIENITLMDRLQAIKQKFECYNFFIRDIQRKCQVLGFLRANMSILGANQSEALTHFLSLEFPQKCISEQQEFQANAQQFFRFLVDKQCKGNVAAAWKLIMQLKVHNIATSPQFTQMNERFDGQFFYMIEQLNAQNILASSIYLYSTLVYFCRIYRVGLREIYDYELGYNNAADSSKTLQQVQRLRAQHQRTLHFLPRAVSLAHKLRSYNDISLVLEFLDSKELLPLRATCRTLHAHTQRVLETRVFIADQQISQLSHSLTQLLEISQSQDTEIAKNNQENDKNVARAHELIAPITIAQLNDLRKHFDIEIKVAKCLMTAIRIINKNIQLQLQGLNEQQALSVIYLRDKALCEQLVDFISNRKRVQIGEPSLCEYVNQVLAQMPLSLANSVDALTRSVLAWLHFNSVRPNPTGELSIQIERNRSIATKARNILQKLNQK